MAIPHHRMGDLRGSILRVIGQPVDRSGVTQLVNSCRALASTFLAGKASAGTLASYHGISLNDLAYDCIAELFRQDEQGNYVELKAYFGGLQVEKLSDDEVLPHLRRLVFSKVNQGIFRLYSETDPSLSKILRNIRLAIASLKNFTEAERFGETHIAPSLADTLEHLPSFDREDLERRFLEITTGKEFIPQLLAKLSLFLREQEEHSRVLPLISVGVMFRRVYEEKRSPASETESDVTQTAIGMNDVLAHIRDACEHVKERIRPKYVGRGKVTESVFCCYFRAIEEEIINRVRGLAGTENTLYRALRSSLPDLSREEYHEIHRGRIEYLLKLVSKRISVRLQQ